jgi:ribosomal-protein-serine acetyltransferase
MMGGDGTFINPIAQERSVTAIPPPLFSFSLAPGEALVPRTPTLTDAYHDLLIANRERLARWEPWALTPPVLEETREFLEASMRNWLAGTELPVAIAVRRDDQWYLAGAVSLQINGYTRSAEIGYWIDGGHEGHGLATRAVAAVLDHAFGSLDIDRVALHTDAANERSRALARRLGFVEEGLLRQGLAFPDERRDEAVYGLLASEWNQQSP